MPVVSLTLPEITQTVVRPSLMHIVREVMSITKITSDVSVVFTSEINSRAVQNATMGTEKDLRVQANFARFLTVEVNDEYNEEDIANMTIHQNNHANIFGDPDIEVAMWPAYIKNDYIINFVYRTPSKSEALRWRDDIRARVSQTRDVNTHEIEYNYTIPKEVEAFIRVLHQYKQRLEPSVGDVDTYTRTHTTPRLKLISDTTGGNMSLVVSERQIRILGMFDFSGGAPEKVTRDEESGAFLCSFTYKVTFEKPALLAIKYPIMVYNQLLPKEYIGFMETQRKAERHRELRYSKNAADLSKFEARSLLEKPMNLDAPFKIPSIDEIKIRTSHPGYGSILSVLCEIEKENNTLFSLRDLGDLMFDEDVLAFLEDGEYEYVTTPYHSVFYFGLHQNPRFFDAPKLSLSRDLVLSSVEHLDERRINRVLISICADLSMLREATMVRLRKHPIAMLKILASMNEALMNYPELMHIAMKKKLNVDDIYLAYVRNAVHTDRKKAGDATVSFRTSQLHYIVAEKK